MMMRKAFSMITAVFMIVLLATVAGFILNTSAKTVKATTFQYQQEQAILYAKSYTELAIMFATANDAQAGGNCAEDINADIGDPDNGAGYMVQTRISYIGNSIQCTDPTRILNTPPVTIVTANAVHIIVDVFVRYRDLDVIALRGASATPWVTYHRRTLQKL